MSNIINKFSNLGITDQCSSTSDAPEDDKKETDEKGDGAAYIEMPTFEDEISQTIANRNEEKQLSADALNNKKDELYFRGRYFDVGHRHWDSSAETQRYLRGCLWSPDGTCVLVAVNGDGMHIFDVPTEVKKSELSLKSLTTCTLKSEVEVPETNVVYDCAWYPRMNSDDYVTCCWLSSHCNEPMQLWDAYTGHLICSYRGLEGGCQLDTALSVSFSKGGSKIYGGYTKCIRVFDTCNGGPAILKIPVGHSVSCFANPMHKPNECVFGSNSGGIRLCDLRDSDVSDLKITAHKGPVTSLRFPPERFGDNNKLFSGARNDSRLLQWDLRSPENPVQIYHRLSDVNQNIYFDISPEFNWLATGGTDGDVRIWNLNKDSEDITYGLSVHTDCCNGVAFNPKFPLLATTSGQYHKPIFPNSFKGDGKDRHPIIRYENALIMTWIGPIIKEAVDE